MDKAKLSSFPASILFLFCAIVVYAVAGSPTPDDPGLTEIIIGAFLILAIGAGGFHRATTLSQGRSFFVTSLQILFLCGLILPTLSGVYNDNDKTLMMRDLLAFAFLGLPLFLYRRFENDARAKRVLSQLLVFAGLAFSLRTLLPAFNIWAPEGELLYLSNSPLALFAAVYLAGCLWTSLQTVNKNTLPLSLFLLGCLSLIIAAMLLDVQRATVGAVAIVLFLHAVFTLVKTPRKAVVPVFILVAIVALAFPLVSETMQAIAHKTSQVGLNMRTQEAQAVVGTLSASPVTIFFGLGWGAVFSSPAVGDLDVNYTHSFLTTMLLKGGVILFLFSILMCLAALYQIFLIFQQDRVRGLALAPPFLIPVFLYASHKSLDFGLLLLMIGVWSDGLRSLHPDPASCNKKEHLKD